MVEQSEHNEREKMREAFRQDALKAWEDYLATGHHASMEEVARWLASWVTDHETSGPSPESEIQILEEVFGSIKALTLSGLDFVHCLGCSCAWYRYCGRD